MGARPEQQLVLNFLRAVHDLWIQHPGTYVVQEETIDLVPALAQTCIKSLATDLRDDPHVTGQRSTLVSGCLLNAGQAVRGCGGEAESIALRDILNKVIHGTPTKVEVRSDEVALHFRNSTPVRGFKPRHGGEEPWTDAWFSASEILKILEDRLYKHRNRRATARETEIAHLIAILGFERFLQRAVA